MKYENIIWDWNGTLLNDTQLCVDIANQILANHNDKQLDLASYREVFGFPITAYYEKIGIDFEKESFEQLTDIFINAYNADVKNNGLHEQVNEVLQMFGKSGIDQYILTAAYKKDAIKLLEHYGILHFFKTVEGLDNYRAESKIDRGLYLLKSNAIDKAKTILIGDTIHDLEVANALGIHCILIANGHQSKERLTAKANSVTKVIANISELENILL